MITEVKSNRTCKTEENITRQRNEVDDNYRKEQHERNRK